MQLKSVSRLLCVLTSVVALAGVARAQGECNFGCSMQGRACFGTANVAMLACKATCRATAKRTEIGACSRACTDTFKKAKDTCRTNIATCRNACAPSPVACRGVCGQNLATCVRAVVANQQSCFGACKTASDHPACKLPCLAAARVGHARCTLSFGDCAAKCGGSPSGAFVEAAPQPF
jgi:hypothetical protein